MATRLIDTDRNDAKLRLRVVGIQRRRILVSRIAGSAQERDLSAPPNCDGYGRIRHFRRAQLAGWPDNPLPMRPASRWLGIQEPGMIQGQVFQLAACAWRCWYCYVPYALLSAAPTQSDWKSADELFDMYAAEPKGGAERGASISMGVDGRMEGSSNPRREKERASY
jgi:hypothetical protein